MAAAPPAVPPAGTCHQSVAGRANRGGVTERAYLGSERWQPWFGGQSSIDIKAQRQYWLLPKKRGFKPSQSMLRSSGRANRTTNLATSCLRRLRSCDSNCANASTCDDIRRTTSSRTRPSGRRVRSFVLNGGNLARHSEQNCELIHDSNCPGHPRRELESQTDRRCYHSPKHLGIRTITLAGRR